MSQEIQFVEEMFLHISGGNLSCGYFDVGTPFQISLLFHLSEP